ncbi:MASE3 domain-containing protein [Clostridium fungisolvens]|uniref:histidine kinase n=1 Tax=Clostridium fungisolvens TaxID=1604897 RepID=A0A6V8SBM8_9CLOT|nr:MASE3 domain-containing protein [Clostridium fungisolvens]GFP74106.1 Adaptive-response sensory-kinase SasA [Clostridium fungisolvens]
MEANMEKTYDNKNYLTYKKIFFTCIYSILSALIVSFIICRWYWDANEELIHAVLELISIIIGVATFLIVWYQSELDNEVNKILGFGFLIVSILDLLHVHYYKYIVLKDIANGQLSMLLEILSQLFQVITLMMFSYKPFSSKNSKYKMLSLTVIIIVVIPYLSKLTYKWIPRLYNEKGNTAFRIMLELLIITLVIVTLNKLRSRIEETHFVRFQYIFLSVIMIIPSELCYIVFNSKNSFYVVLAYLFKIGSYYFLYKAVFSCMIRYPYTKLIEGKQRLEDILNDIPIAIYTYNSSNRVDFVNNKFEELSRHEKSSIIGLNNKELSKVIPKAGNGEEERLFDKETLLDKVYENDKEAKNIVRTYIDGNGNPVKVLVNVYKIRNGALVLINDIKREQEIDNLHLQTKAILDSIAVPIMILDGDNKITACNNSYLEIIDRSDIDLVGMSYEELRKDIGFIETKGSLALNQDKDVNKEYEGYLTTGDGLSKQISGTYSPILNIDNETIGAISIVQDLTEKKEKQQKLINQEKLALLGQFGATIVHETRNFLTTIKGSSQLIDLYSEDLRIKEYARRIDTSTDEVNRIITDFLSLSKPRETDLLEVSFNDLILSMKGIIETSSLLKGIDLVLDLDYDERYILCDETQIRQVILNICKNAVEAMYEVNSPVLRISSGLRTDSNEIFIKISDNGNGIPKEMIKKIGTPFYSTKKNGTGLGMNACFNIIEEHCGKIEIQSVVGEGTTFTIVIPYIDEDLEDII